MIKRTLAFIFLFIANITILAYAIIPHHHHQDEVCVINNHCESNHEHENNSHNEEQSHEHHGGTNADYCVLNQVFVVKINNVYRNIIPTETDNNFIHGYNNIGALADKSCFSELYLLHLRQSHPVDKLILNSSYSRSFGLRAPPIV